MNNEKSIEQRIDEMFEGKDANLMIIHENNKDMIDNMATIRDFSIIVAAGFSFLNFLYLIYLIYRL